MKVPFLIKEKTYELHGLVSTSFLFSFCTHSRLEKWRKRRKGSLVKLELLWDALLENMSMYLTTPNHLYFVFQRDWCCDMACADCEIYWSESIDLCFIECWEDTKNLGQSHRDNHRWLSSSLFSWHINFLSSILPTFPRLDLPPKAYYLGSPPLHCHSSFYPCNGINTFLDEMDRWTSVSH